MTTESKFIFIRNYTKKTYVIHWTNSGISYQGLQEDYKKKNPKDKFAAMGGGKLLMELDKKLVVLFGKTSDVGQFNLELVNHWAKVQFPNWTVVCNPWSDTAKEAMAGWTSCQFQYQIYHNVYDKAVYSAILKSKEELPQIYPTANGFMVLTESENYKVGSFVNPEDIYEIKRISHKRSRKK